jgi:hypothetical protein
MNKGPAPLATYRRTSAWLADVSIADENVRRLSDSARASDRQADSEWPVKLERRRECERADQSGLPGEGAAGTGVAGEMGAEVAASPARVRRALSVVAGAYS